MPGSASRRAATVQQVGAWPRVWPSLARTPRRRRGIGAIGTRPGEGSPRPRGPWAPWGFPVGGSQAAPAAAVLCQGLVDLGRQPPGAALPAASQRARPKPGPPRTYARGCHGKARWPPLAAGVKGGMAGPTFCQHWPLNRAIPLPTAALALGRPAEVTTTTAGGGAGRGAACTANRRAAAAAVARSTAHSAHE